MGSPLKSVGHLNTTGAPQVFVKTLLVAVRAAGALWGASAPGPPRPRGGPSAKPEGPRRPEGVGPVGPRTGRPACAGRAGRAALLPNARQGGAAPRPSRSWRGRTAWAASPNCNWRPSRRRRRQPRTRHSCPSPRPRAHPAARGRRPPRPSSSPARPRLSAGAFGFSAASRTLAARRVPGKCTPVAVVSSLPWSAGRPRSGVCS